MSSRQQRSWLGVKEGSPVIVESAVVEILLVENVTPTGLTRVAEAMNKEAGPLVLSVRSSKSTRSEINVAFAPSLICAVSCLDVPADPEFSFEVLV